MVGEAVAITAAALDCPPSLPPSAGLEVWISLARTHTAVGLPADATRQPAEPQEESVSSFSFSFPSFFLPSSLKSQCNGTGFGLCVRSEERRVGKECSW